VIFCAGRRRELQPGNRVLGVEFVKERLGERHETHGTAKLYVDDQVVAEGPLRTQPGHFALARGLWVGRDTGDAVSKEYTPQLPFTGGRIIKVEVSIGDDVYLNIDCEFAAAMARDQPGPVAALHWLRHYRRVWLGGDVLAALTTWALVVPQAIAYAQIAGLPPQAGLFAAFYGLLGYGLFGTCRQLVVSPTSSTAAISAAIVAPVALGDATRYADLSAFLAMLVGVVLIALGLLRMGFVSRFIAAGVQVGFMFGLGLTIIVGQLPKLLGVPAGQGDFFGQAGDLAGRLGHVHPWTAAVGLASLAVLLGLKRVAPGVPAALLVVVGGIAVVALLDLTAHGVEVIGAVDGAVPLPAVPRVGWDELVGLLPGAIAVAIIGYAESATVAESMANEHGYDVEPDRELRAVGIACGPAAAVPGPAPGGPGRRGGHAGRAGPGRAPGADRGRGRLRGGLPGPGQPPQRLGARPDPGHERLCGPGARPGGPDRAGAARVPAERAAAVRQRQAPARRDPGRGARRRPAGPGRPARPVVHPELDIESVDVLASLRHELDRRGVALWLAGVRAGVGDMLARSGLADAIGRDHLYREVEDAAGDASA
jgi:hypothetical protein